MKIALVTGGSSGIGLATAETLMQAGMCVYAVSRNITEKTQTHSSGGQIISMRMDVNNTSDIHDVINHIISAHSQLDILICSAGNGIAGAIEETTVEEAQYQFETCFWGMVKTINACLPILRKQGHGRIITISSVAGIIPIPFQGFYSAVKAAVISYTKALALELMPFGVQCCCVLPGDTKTNFTATRRYAEISQKTASVYSRQMHHAVGKMERDELNGMCPQKIATCIMRQLKSRHMPIVVVPRINYKLFALAVRLFPNNFVLWLVRNVYL